MGGKIFRRQEGQRDIKNRHASPKGRWAGKEPNQTCDRVT